MRQSTVAVWIFRTVIALAIAMSVSCASDRAIDESQQPKDTPATSAPRSEGPARSEATSSEDRADLSSTDAREQIVELGSGVFIGSSPRTGAESTEDGDITLRFENTDIREFIRAVLGDILGVTYAIGTDVTGTVTVHTSAPITMEQVLPLFEEVLSANSAALLKIGDLYQVVSRAGSVRHGRATTMTGDADNPGLRTQIIPLEFIGAREMLEILESTVPESADLRIDQARNLLIASASADELRDILELIDIFDVDWLRGMSIGLYPLDFVSPGILEDELSRVLGEAMGQSDILSGLVRLVPIDRLGSLLVVSSTPAALREAETWIRRLDRPSESAGRRLYVYQVENAKATELADILDGIFGSRRNPTDSRDTRGSARDSVVAPELVPTQIGANPRSPQSTRDMEVDSRADTETGFTLSGGTSIDIIADDVRNALVVLATPGDYRMVESALKQLDVVPLQVLIEASILEVSLRDDLSYGVEWFFRNTVDNKDGFGALDLGAAGITPLAPGFSYSVIDNADRVRVALNLLAAESEVNVLSSPSLMVLDNQTATINVGDEIPIPARQSISNLDPIAPTVNEITFRQTGVTLSVTPRVNNSGLVTMEIHQEVATAATTTTSNIDAPTIQSRLVESVVAIHSGDTIVLGGLMRDQQASSGSGLPGLRRIPGLGKLFGRTIDEHDRTELLVLITPHVVRNRDDARAITDEFRDKLEHIERFELPPHGGTAP